jgi:hypothetical protein
MVRNWGLIKHKIFFKRLSFSFKKTKSYSARIKDQRKRLNFFCYFGGEGGQNAMLLSNFSIIFFLSKYNEGSLFLLTARLTLVFLVQTNFQNRTSVMMMRGEFEEDRKISGGFSTFSLTESSSDM